MLSDYWLEIKDKLEAGKSTCSNDLTNCTLCYLCYWSGDDSWFLSNQIKVNNLFSWVAYLVQYSWPREFTAACQNILKNSKDHVKTCKSLLNSAVLGKTKDNARIWNTRLSMFIELSKSLFTCYSAPFHWLVHGHMTSKNETVSRQMQWAGNIVKTMT